ncbi:adenylate/guanylate cyclase domain-containing protein [Agrobacterium larrymoorei]|uniref:adenylate/guanylate cyclase domain-containing protein n=1 Tax=Agrobacterium larrymoorei TaxID=160699 RepID=UPI001572CD35|nr:adenylate/guanylate cyclase domain-containing protein [Agrobacterium larrymoorei]NTJ44132.1 adenylate/guanylate cyclase domain-containing protein [Agrobacterium larrymoorei]
MNHRIPSTGREAIKDLQFASLRFVAVSILIANLVFGNNSATSTSNMIVSFMYLCASVASVVAAVRFPALKVLNASFVILDAGLVTVVLYYHLLASPVTAEHNLTTSSLAIAFILLNNIALKLDHQLIAVFSTIVVTSWVTMKEIMSYRHHVTTPTMQLSDFFNQDLILTASYGFTALALYLLMLDYDRTRKHSLLIDERRMNLSRFFSPTVVSDLEDASGVLDLERRNAAVMFVDIRDFTQYSETAPASELARVLAEYRRIVAGTVFAYGGTVDKFMGDGAMAVFGQPKSQRDDAHRALSCALELVTALDGWRWENIKEGVSPLKTGIGLHYGSVLGGVIESGFHDEFTVIGDAVNVAQRLDKIAKKLRSPLVVSKVIIDKVPGAECSTPWLRQDRVQVEGRKELIDIAYLE